MALDIALTGGTVIDGTGAPRRLAGVGIRDDRIVTVGELTETAGRTIDVTGKMVVPGFIDVHAHSDFVLLRDPFNPEKVMQGVTTNVIGNCALSPAPATDMVRLFFEKLLRHVFGSIDVRWNTFAELLAVYENEGITPNIKSLAGHGAMRMSAMGMEARPPEADELQQMRRYMAEAMEAGACGLSTGLIYPPGSFAATDEIVELAKVASEHGGLYATHMRNEDAHLLEAITEAITIGEQSGAPVQVSHHKAMYLPNWGLVKQSLALLDAARGRGLDIRSDVYPYVAASTTLGPCLADIDKYPESSVLMVATKNDKSLEGRVLQEVAAERGQGVFECAQDINDSEEGAVTIVMFGICEDDVETVMSHPHTMIGSDGIESDIGHPHPRAYGTFPKVLGDYSRDRGVIDLETAVFKMTGLAADRFQLAGRGEVGEGKFADLVVFDPETVADVATYEEPRQHPAGIDYVLVNGRVVVDNGAPRLDARPGRVLRHNQGQ